ncbi:hypothetical protein QTJ16_006180 [Diplocarpon rosae]|uniref:Uncharacterized protein n=1 Tax=Diplocarpon rosae TaxID=946125 RepID=A0AAD9SWY8_9HELO|nr:hypothetical protein QTJ16_006180 [Diplocarpon rosae]
MMSNHSTSIPFSLSPLSCYIDSLYPVYDILSGAEDGASRLINRQALHEAILLPFSGFTRDPYHILTREEKVQKILKNVKSHQAAVRGNMVSLALQKSVKLRSRARADIDVPDQWLEGEEDEEEKAARKREQEELVKFLRFPSREGAERQDYETKVLRKDEITPAGKENRAMNGDTTRRRPHSTLKDLSFTLRNLIDDTTHQLEAYDVLSASTLHHYTGSLSRRTSKGGGSAMSPTPTSPIDRKSRVKFSMSPNESPLQTTPLLRAPAIPSILKRNLNSGHSPGSPVDPVGLSRRMINGMPIAGWSGLKAAEPTRTVESIEDLTRGR